MAETTNKTVATVSGLIGTVIGVTFTFFTGVSSLKSDIAVLQSMVRSNTDDRYRGADARRDFALVQQQIASNAKQIDELHSLLARHAETADAHHRPDR